MADESDISDETRMLAEGALRRARDAPGTADIAGMERDALSAGRGEMSPDEIRRLAADAASQAAQVSALMARLADLLEADPDGRHGR